MWRQTELARRPVPPVSPRCTEEPLVEPFRTAVRAEMAKSGHAIHPAICRSDAPELGVVVVACGGHCEALRENEHSWPKLEMQPPLCRSFSEVRSLQIE